jgi:hypothetical protein
MTVADGSSPLWMIHRRRGWLLMIDQGNECGDTQQEQERRQELRPKLGQGQQQGRKIVQASQQDASQLAPPAAAPSTAGRCQVVQPQLSGLKSFACGKRRRFEQDQ